MLGMGLILLCVICISLSGQNQKYHASGQSPLPVVMSAIFVGATFAANLLAIKLILNKYEFTPMEMMQATNWSISLILLPFFIFDQTQNGYYSLKDLFESIITFHLVNLG